MNPYPELVYSAGLVSPVGDLAIGVGPNDAPMISFVDYKFNDQAIRHAVGTGTSWAIETIQSHPNANQPVDLVVDAAGTAHVHWWKCYYSQRSPSGIWTHDFSGSCTLDSDSVGFALDGSGAVHAGLEWSAFELRYRHRPPAGGWMSETILAVGPPGGVALALDGGTPTVAFYDPDAFYDLPTGIRYAYPDGNGWAVAMVDPNFNGTGDRLDMVHDASGTTHICYGGGALYVASGNVTTGWTIGTVGPPGAFADCAMALDNTGNAHMCSVSSVGQAFHHQHDGVTWASSVLPSVPFSAADHCSIAVDGQDRAWIAVDSHAQPSGVYATRLP